jgi:hypothetical protein
MEGINGTLEIRSGWVPIPRLKTFLFIFSFTSRSDVGGRSAREQICWALRLRFHFSTQYSSESCLRRLLGRGEAGEQRVGVLEVDLVAGVLIHGKGFQLVGEGQDARVAGVGEVAAVEDVVGGHRVEEQAEDLVRAGQGQVEVEGAGVLEDLVGGLGREVGLEHDVGDAFDQVGQRAAGVRQDHLAVRVVALRVRQDQVHGRPRRLVRVVDHGLQQGRIRKVRVDGVRGMHEDDGLAPVELRPDGRERLAAQIVVARSVSREDRHTVRLERVERVGDLSQRALRVEQRRQRGEEAVSRRVLVAQPGGVLVHLSRQLSGGLRVVGDGGARRRQGEDGRRRAHLHHQLVCVAQDPGGHWRSGRVAARVFDRYMRGTVSMSTAR